ncbi:hypothetical protein HDU98_002492 [Podochytrium sp. JEL0797]|nr:hypothetical protein HDU98_002492 [Podochytrium sp. JEL0797]
MKSDGKPKGSSAPYHPFPGMCESTNPRLKSCEGCRLANRKCSRGGPCDRCAKLGRACVYSQNSTRSKAFRQLKRISKEASLPASESTPPPVDAAAPHPDQAAPHVTLGDPDPKHAALLDEIVAFLTAINTSTAASTTTTDVFGTASSASPTTPTPTPTTTSPPLPHSIPEFPMTSPAPWLTTGAHFPYATTMFAQPPPVQVNTVSVPTPPVLPHFSLATRSLSFLPTSGGIDTTMDFGSFHAQPVVPPPLAVPVVPFSFSLSPSCSGGVEDDLFVFLNSL